MSETGADTILCFSASFPRDGQYAATAGDLAARMAQAIGFSEAEARDIATAIGAAFGEAIAGAPHQAASPIEVSLCTCATSFDASVTCGQTPIAGLSRPRPR